MSTPTPKPVQFRVMGMDVPEFAILRRDANLKLNFGIRIDAGYTVNESKRLIQTQYKLTLVQDENPFLLLVVLIAFQIKEDSWGLVINETERVVTVSEQLASHFGVLVVGAMRGVLFEKLRRTEYATLVLPTIDISSITKEHRIPVPETPHG